MQRGSHRFPPRIGSCVAGMQPFKYPLRLSMSRTTIKVAHQVDRQARRYVGLIQPSWNSEKGSLWGMHNKSLRQKSAGGERETAV